MISAYTRFALDLITRFDPEYFNIASEASELLLNDQTDGTSNFPAFVNFATQVIPAIRAQHPDLPILVSVADEGPGLDRHGGPDRRPAAVDRSTRPGRHQCLPVCLLRSARRRSRGPDLRLAEAAIEALSGTNHWQSPKTGWIAEDLEIASFGLNVQSSPARQNQYVEILLDEAESLDARFVIWFTIVDYDALSDTFPPGAVQDLGKIWRDTGLFDQDRIPRAALMTWDRTRERPLQ
ncbi:MAG: hypothetical protein U5K33_09570 [Halofilum sp. (in: g-proteobacteria)]|nr:hypothetical protein [Halofilum sp. (in: g-proteobacteria)]